MLYWNPNTIDTTEWSPVSGWNNSFSDEDKIKCTNLFFFFKFKKGFSDSVAEVLSQMVIYKEKYNGMKYSEEQELLLKRALEPIFNTL